MHAFRKKEQSTAAKKRHVSGGKRDTNWTPPELDQLTH